MPTLEFDFGANATRYTIHYRVKGTGPDVLLIHGMGSSLRMWKRPQAKLAAAGFRAWAVDLPGSGQSSAPDGLNDDYAITNLAGCLQVFATRVGIKRMALIGHSMGGAVALALAAIYPDSVNALVLVAPVVSGQIGFSLHRPLGTSGGQKSLGFFQRHTRPVRLARTLAYVAHLLIPDPALRRDASDLALTAPAALVGNLRAVLDFDLDQLPPISAPTLIIAGSRDRTLPPSEGERAAQKIPGAVFVKMRGAGHQLIDERPDEFDRSMIDFLQTHHS